MSLLSGKAVVVPWDFSQLSHQALRKALSLTGDASLIHVVHVTQFPPVMEPGMVWGTLDEESIMKQCHASFQKVQQEHADYNGVHFTTLLGDPGLTVADFAKEKNAELIVISSHGHSGLSRLLLGSVAERVVRLSHCPVLVLRS